MPGAAEGKPRQKARSGTRLRLGEECSLTFDRFNSLSKYKNHTCLFVCLFTSLAASARGDDLFRKALSLPYFAHYFSLLINYTWNLAHFYGDLLYCFFNRFLIRPL